MKRFNKVIASLAFAGVLSTLGTPAFASAPTVFTIPITTREDVGLLDDFGIVIGDETGNLQLDKTITRAEMIKVMIAAAGLEEYAQLLKGAPSFSDVADHWASGYIALAKARGLALGYPDGTFKPNGQVTYEEAVAFISRVAELNPNNALRWPMNYVEPAVTAGIIPPGLDLISKLGQPAVRRDVFGIADLAFLKVKGADGKTVYQRNFDKTPPVVTLDTLPASTSTLQATISGVATDAATVIVGGVEATVAPDGRFSVTVDLNMGENNIEVRAYDIVGNETVVPVKIERVAAAAQSIDVTKSITVKAGEEIDLPIRVLDSNGVEMPDASIEVTSDVEGLGTYIDGKFKAGTKAQTGKLTVKHGEIETTVDVTITPGDLAKLVVLPENISIAPASHLKLEVKGYDAYDNEIEGITPTFSVEGDAFLDNNGNFIAAKPGVYKVTVTYGGITATHKVGVYGETAKVGISAPNEMVANVITDPSRNDRFVSGKLYDVEFYALDEWGNINRGDNETVIELPTTSGMVFYAIDHRGEAKGHAAITRGTVKNGVLKVKAGVLAGFDGLILEMEAGASDYSIEPGTAKVEAIEPIPTKVTISGLPQMYSIREGSKIGDIQIKILDQTGAELLNGFYEAELRITGPATFDGRDQKKTTVTLIDGYAEVPLYTEYYETGTITVSVSVDGLEGSSYTLQAVVSGPATKFEIKITDPNGKEVKEPVVADGSTEYTVVVRAVDSKGARTDINIPSTVTINFGTTKLDGLTITGLTSGNTLSLDAYGEGRFTIVSSTFVGDLIFKVEQKGYTTSTGKIQFTAGEATNVALLTNDSTAVDGISYLVESANPELIVIAQLYDDQGNPAGRPGVPLIFTAYQNGKETNQVTLNGKKGTVTVATDDRGQAKVTVKALPYVDEVYTIEVNTDTRWTDVVPKTINNANTLTFKVVNTVVTKAELSLLADGTENIATSVNPDTQTINIKVVLKDKYGRPVSGQAGYLALDVDKIIWDADSGKLVDNTEKTAVLYKFMEDPSEKGTYWLVDVADSAFTAPAPVVLAKAGRQTITVKYSGTQNTVTASRSIQVRSGSYAGLVVLDENGNVIEEVTVPKNSIAGPFDLRLVDAYGNFISTMVKQKIDVSGGHIRATAGGANLTGTEAISTANRFTFFVSAGASGEEMQITFTDSDDPSISTTVTFKAK